MDSVMVCKRLLLANSAVEHRAEAKAIVVPLKKKKKVDDKFK